MKKIVFCIIALCLSSTYVASAQGTSEIIIIRETGLTNLLLNFSIFKNGEFVEKIPNYSTSTLTVPPGETTLSFQYFGKKKPNVNAEKLVLNVQAGEKKYVMLTQVQVPFRSKIIPLEVTEYTASRYYHDANVYSNSELGR